MHSLYDLFTTRTFLGVDSAGNPSPRRLRICVAALLWEMAAADGTITDEEVWQAIDLLQNEFKIWDREAIGLLDVADCMRKENHDFNETMAELNKSFSPAQKSHLYGVIIRIARADGVIRRCEKEFASYLRARLGLRPDINEEAV